MSTQFFNKKEHLDFIVLWDSNILHFLTTSPPEERGTIMAGYDLVCPSINDVRTQPTGDDLLILGSPIAGSDAPLTPVYISPFCPTKIPIMNGDYYYRATRPLLEIVVKDTPPCDQIQSGERVLRLNRPMSTTEEALGFLNNCLETRPAPIAWTNYSLPWEVSGDLQPAVGLTWGMANDYCLRHGAALLTEAQGVYVEKGAIRQLTLEGGAVVIRWKRFDRARGQEIVHEERVSPDNLKTMLLMNDLLLAMKGARDYEEFSALFRSRPQYQGGATILEGYYLLVDSLTGRPLTWEEARVEAQKGNRSVQVLSLTPDEALRHLEGGTPLYSYHAFGGEEQLRFFEDVGLSNLVRPTSPRLTAFVTNDFGLSAVRGVVREWRRDSYSDGAYASYNPLDPQGPQEGRAHVLGGVSWADITPVTSDRLPLVEFNRWPTAIRDYNGLPNHEIDIGARCAAAPMPK